MQIVLPVPTAPGTSWLRSAASISHLNVWVRSRRKLTNGPAAVALASSSVGWNAAAISVATWAGLFLAAFAIAKQPTARSPSSGRGGASTLRSVAATPALAATAWAAARWTGVWWVGIGGGQASTDRAGSAKGPRILGSWFDAPATRVLPTIVRTLAGRNT